MSSYLKSLFRRGCNRVRRYVRYAHLYALFRKPCVFLFGVPFHSNLGDQAQTYCILEWIRKYLPKYQVCITMLTTATAEHMYTIRQVFRKGDILLCHSGYHMTDLYNEKDVYEQLARNFPEEELRILPQTIHFLNPERALDCAEVFNAHGKCTLLCRDAYSYETAQSMFGRCKTHLYPDIVTSLIGVFPQSFPQHREGVLFCMRNDKEALYSKEQIAAIRQRIEDLFPTQISDTTVDLPAEYIAENRQQVLAETFADMAKYRVVVTDRYHGTIFSLVSNTPVIVVNSTDHKLSSGVKWFPSAFREHVFFAEHLEDVPGMVAQIMDKPHPAPLPPYFEEKYYGRKLLKTLDLTRYA